MAENKYQYLRAANILHGSYYDVSGSVITTCTNDAYRRWAKIEGLTAGDYTFSLLSLSYTILKFADESLHRLSEWDVNALGGTITVPQDFTLYPSVLSRYVYTATMFVNDTRLPDHYVEGLYDGEEDPEPISVDDTSILTSVKQGLGGIPPDNTDFDENLVLHINTVLQRFYQLRIGPIDKPFRITGVNETWGDFLGAETCLDAYMEMCKSDLVLRVRLLFDPPDSSYAIENIKALIKEFEWCMNAQVDDVDTFYEPEDT